MNALNINRALVAALVTWTISFSIYGLLYTILPNHHPEFLANGILTLVLVPVVYQTTRFYYKASEQTNGLRLGVSMVSIHLLLDALITVPFLVFPTGGDHFSFFSYPGFWSIPFEYVLIVTLYWVSQETEKTIRKKSSPSF